MKIVVNKERAQQRKDEVVAEIMASAKDHAERGLTSFSYFFKTGERYSFPGKNISLVIQEVSEGTVQCKVRGDHGNSMDFIIVP